MKVQIKDYTFNKTNKTIAFNDYTSIDLDSVLLITDVSTNTFLYNFASPALGGTVSGNVLTLKCDTSALSNSDALLIYYDDNSLVPVSQAQLAALITVLEDRIANDDTMARQMISLLQGFGIRTTATGRTAIDVYQPTAANLNATVVQGTAANLLATVTFAANQDIRTVTTLTNQTNIGGLNALDVPYYMARAAWNTGVRGNVTF